MMARRLTAALIVLALFGAWAAPCAGWGPTSKARHDCCAEGQCPAQLNAGGHSERHGGNVSTSEADRCCAASEEQGQQQRAQSVGTVFLPVAPIDSVLVAADDLTAPKRIDPDVIPVFSPPAPLHLLFSVFLV